MDKAEELRRQFIKDWTPPGMEEATPGAFEGDLNNLLQQYAEHEARKAWNTVQIDVVKSINDITTSIFLDTFNKYWKSKQQNNE
jgi:hypothetical protein